MTEDDIPSNPSVLNTTVLSNFAYIDEIEIVARLSDICTVPVVREEFYNGLDDYPYLQSALDVLDDGIPITPISETVANREAVIGAHLDPGEAQAFALADAHDGRLLTDNDARRLPKNKGRPLSARSACFWPPSMLGGLMKKLLTSGSQRGSTRSDTTFRTETSQTIDN